MKLVFLILAIICFILAALSISTGTLALVPLGLAFGFASFLPIP